MTSPYDIAIVGAGPAGSSLAIRLALAGKSVVLIEKEKFPRQKLCGEFISPECLEHFGELGVLDEIRRSGAADLKDTIFYGRSGRGVAVPAMFGGTFDAALGLSRAEMDLRLMQRAREVSVDVLEETTAVSLEMKNDRVAALRVKCGGAEQTFNASTVVDATGRGRALARKSDRELTPRAKFVAFKTHVRGVDVPDDRCEIFSYRGGYGGTSRVEGGAYNLCFIAAAADVRRLGSDTRRVFREVVCSNRRAAHVFRGVECTSDWLAVPIERFGRGSLSPVTGLITVGDAAAFIDPFTGSGMLLAVESSRVAAECILTSDVEDLAAEYERRYRATFDRRLRVCSWLRRASFIPLLSELTIAALGLSTGLTGSLVRDAF